MQKLEDSYDSQSLQKGHDNDYIYKNIHHIINYLVSVELLPSSAVIGRQSLGTMTRTAINFPYESLFQIRDEVWMALFNYGISDPDEVMKILFAGCVLAGTNGFFHFDNAGVEVFSQTMQPLPRRAQCLVMNSELHKRHILEHSVA